SSDDSESRPCPSFPTRRSSDLYEFVRDTARLIRKKGMKNVLVTNGCVELPVLEEVLPYIDAMNIDLKGFREEWYQRLGGNLQTRSEEHTSELQSRFDLVCCLLL